MNRSASSPDNLARQRAGARRTALGVGLVALVIYVAFLARGVLGA
jgi:hypothetical protein